MNTLSLYWPLEVVEFYLLYWANVKREWINHFPNVYVFILFFVLPRNNNRMTNVGYKKSIARTLTKIAKGCDGRWSMAQV